MQDNYNYPKYFSKIVSLLGKENEWISRVNHFFFINRIDGSVPNSRFPGKFRHSPTQYSQLFRLPRGYHVDGFRMQFFRNWFRVSAGLLRFRTNYFTPLWKGSSHVYRSSAILRREKFLPWKPLFGNSVYIARQQQQQQQLHSLEKSPAFLFMFLYPIVLCDIKMMRS